MARYVVMVVLVAGIALFGGRSSQADVSTTPTPVFCTELNGSLDACIQTPTPTPTVQAPQANIRPTKAMSVASPHVGPYGTTQYLVDITSQLACFSLLEPVEVNVLGNPAAVAISELSPEVVPSSGTHVTVRVDGATGHAQLSLEILGSQVGPGGIDLKALWPQENLELFQNIVAPSPPTLTPTALPNQPTDTPLPTATPGDTPTPVPTATPRPAAPTSGVQACVDPPVVRGLTQASSGSGAILYGRTVPGSICTAGVTDYLAFAFANYGDTYITGISHPASFKDGPQTANEEGIVAYSWIEQSMANFGIGTVTCTQDGGKPQTACTAFLISQVSTDYLNTLPTAAVDQVLLHLEKNHCPAGATFGV
jgi:hypothetical protein